MAFNIRYIEKPDGTLEKVGDCRQCGSVEVILNIGDIGCEVCN